MRLRVEKLDKEEVYRGWVRIPEEHRRDSKGLEIQEASVVSIRHNGKELLAIVRGLAGEDEPVIKMDEISRKVLGVEQGIGRPLDFDLVQAGWFGQFSFHWNHPEPTSRFAMRMAILSLAAGVFGFAVGLIGAACWR